MINFKTFAVSFFFILIVCISCDTEKDITLPLIDNSGTLVIEGNVTDDEGPYFVSVTRSLKIFQNEEVPVVDNAIVVLSDNKGQSEVLKFEDGVYVTDNFTSHYGDTYSLSVTVDGKNYKATSTMPQLVKLDSLQQIKLANSDGGNRIGILPVFKDPPQQGNYYLFKKYGVRKKYAVLSDNLDNGQINKRAIFTNEYFSVNDTVMIEMQSVDGPVYDYFKALANISDEFNENNITSNPPSNISNGALGYFSAHASSEKAIIIK